LNTLGASYYSKPGGLQLRFVWGHRKKMRDDQYSAPVQCRLCRASVCAKGKRGGGGMAHLSVQHCCGHTEVERLWHYYWNTVKVMASSLQYLQPAVA